MRHGLPLVTLLIGFALGIGSIAAAGGQSRPASDARVVRAINGLRSDVAGLHDEVAAMHADADTRLDLVNKSLSGYSALASPRSLFDELKAVCQQGSYEGC